uniref:G-protein coupled receptors family 1 profile domain-containing protein n=1 Tax=Romanomermis culicivorax TaxID=13658 RepID=A0A915IE32_ROMCU
MSLLSSCFNNLSSYNISLLNQISINNLQTLKIAYLVWVLISFLNVPAAILTFVAARKSKAMRGTTTNAFLQQANFCITIASISFSIMGMVHISNWYFGIPETQCRYACFIRISHQSLLFSLANTFILVMAVDRFFAMVTPLQYSNLIGTSCSNNSSVTNKRITKVKQEYQQQNPPTVMVGEDELVRNISLTIWTLELLFYGLRFFDKMNPILTACTFTMVEGRYSFYVLCCKLLFFGLLSIVLYLSAIFVVHKQHNGSTVVKDIANTNSSSLAEIRRRHQKQMFKALTLHSVVQTFTLMVCYVKLLYGAVVLSDRGSTNGPYFTVLNTTSGLSNFIVYLICLKVFRQNCVGLFTGSEPTTMFTN